MNGSSGWVTGDNNDSNDSNDSNDRETALRNGRPLRLGVIVNPVAGVGGPAGLKGSDGQAVQAQAFARGGVARAGDRMTEALRHLSTAPDLVDVVCGPGIMGAASCERAGIKAVSLDLTLMSPTTADDTLACVRQMIEAGIDLLLFAGGDGTARDVLDAIPAGFPSLGIPGGVKMHSGVFAISPSAAGELVLRIAQGHAVSVTEAEVRDIDENSFRTGQVITRFYGVMSVPDDLRYVQQVKSGGREDDELVAIEIAASVAEQIDPDVTYLLGSGSTLLAVKKSLGFDGTLLGVDVFRNGKVLARDVSEQEILPFLSERCAIVVSFIAGQGHVFGRGNQQFSARVIQALGPDNIRIVGSKRKLATLKLRPLLVDTGDVALDQTLTGLRQVTTGYEDAVLYQVSDRIRTTGSE